MLTLNTDYAKIKLVPNNKKKERKSTLKSKQYPLRDQAGSLSTTKKTIKKSRVKNSKNKIYIKFERTKYRYQKQESLILAQDKRWRRT